MDLWLPSIIVFPLPPPPRVLTPHACQVLEESEGWRERQGAERKETRGAQTQTMLSSLCIHVVWSLTSCWQESPFGASCPSPIISSSPQQWAASCQISGRLIGCSSTDVNDSSACALRPRCSPICVSVRFKGCLCFSRSSLRPLSSS